MLHYGDLGAYLLYNIPQSATLVEARIIKLSRIAALVRHSLPGSCNSFARTTHLTIFTATSETPCRTALYTCAASFHHELSLSDGL